MAANIDPDEVSALIRKIADKYILPRWKMLADGEVETKSGPDDLVTIADKEAEAAFARELPALYSGSVVIGEEGIAAGKATTGPLKDKEQIVWVIDPVDGTWNFVQGKAEFAVMVACVYGGEVQMGWIYDVPAGKMTFAQRGKGAFTEGVRLQTASPKTLKDCDGFAANRYFPNPMRPHLQSFESQVKSLGSLRCAGHEYLRLASGQADFALYTKIRPWDHLAGALIMKEAGGTVLKWDGSPYTPSDEFGGLIVASNAALAKDLAASVIHKMSNEFKKKP